MVFDARWPKKADTFNEPASIQRQLEHLPGKIAPKAGPVVRPAKAVATGLRGGEFGPHTKANRQNPVCAGTHASRPEVAVKTGAASGRQFFPEARRAVQFI